MVTLHFQRPIFGSYSDLELPANLSGEADIVLERLCATPAPELPELRKIWKTRPREGWVDRPDIYSQLGEQVLRKGQPLIAYDILIEGTRHRPEDVRLRQLLGLTLARSGALERGNAMLRELGNQGHCDGETLGILASTYKDLWSTSSDPSSAGHSLELSHKVYHQAYTTCVDGGEIESAYYNGINAAATALLLGLIEKAQALAAQVDQLCDRVVAEAPPGKDMYWAVATRGEAALIQENFEQAAEYYVQAANISHGRHADLSATRRQARVLLSYLSQDPNLLDACFALPSVVVFAGCDAECLEPGPQLEGLLRQTLRARLAGLDAGFGYTSLYGMADLVFVEELIASGGEAHVVMPLAQNAFLRNLGSFAGKAEWKNRYQRALELATQVQGVSELADADSTVFREYSQLVLDGLGRLHSHALDTSLAFVALSRDDRPLVSKALADRWAESGDRVEHLEITELAMERGKRPSAGGDDSGPSGGVSYPQRIMALLFADVVGFSHIPEQEVPAFIKHFLGAIARLEATSPYRPVQKNTWGDALYFVFEQTEEAALFALQLSSMVNEVDWSEKGITTPIDLRIALHAGPVYLCDDPIVRRQNCCGTHVNWAARIEPITPPGQVYASQPFAALIKTHGIASVVCDYVGQVPLAKSYGDFPLYHVH